LIYRTSKFKLQVAAFAAAIAMPLAALSQADDKLCTAAPKPELGKMTLHWDSFNMFSNRKESFVETAYAQAGEGSSCKITSQNAKGKTIERPCTWNQRMSCDLQLGKEAITHTFSSGSYQRGKLQWAGNEKLTVKVKRGDATAPEAREVAVVKFNGTWSRGSDRGDSVSTGYYDREWGVMLKIEGAHDANQWGDTITLVDLKP
jgi:hypothetical protein